MLALERLSVDSSPGYRLHGRRRSDCPAVSDPAPCSQSTGAPIFGWFRSGTGNGLSIWTGSDMDGDAALAPTAGHLFATYPVVDRSGTPFIAAVGPPTCAFSSGTPPCPTGPSPARSSQRARLGPRPRLALAPDGSPVVAWVDSTGPTSRIGVARWTAGAWDTRFGLFNAGQSVDVTTPMTALFPACPPSWPSTRPASVWVAWKEGTTAQVWTSNF